MMIYNDYMDDIDAAEARGYYRRSDRGRRPTKKQMHEAAIAEAEKNVAWFTKEITRHEAKGRTQMADSDRQPLAEWVEKLAALQSK